GGGQVAGLADLVPAGPGAQAQHPPGLVQAHPGTEGLLPLLPVAVAGAGVVRLVAVEEALLPGVVRADLEGLLAAGQAELGEVLPAPWGPPGRAAAAPDPFDGVLRADVAPVARLRPDLGAVDPLVGVAYGSSRAAGGLRARPQLPLALPADILRDGLPVGGPRPCQLLPVPLRGQLPTARVSPSPEHGPDAA